MVKNLKQNKYIALFPYSLPFLFQKFPPISLFFTIPLILRLPVGEKRKFLKIGSYEKITQKTFPGVQIQTLSDCVLLYS